MMLSKHSYLSAVMVVVLITMLLAGWAPSRSAAQDDVSGTLNVMGFGMGDEIATVRVDQFKAAYPNVELNIPEGALDNQQFLTAVASGNAPDVVYMGRDVIGTFAARGALVPLTDCIDSQGIDMSQYRDAAVQQVTINGEVYGIPEFFNIIVLIANTKALADAGLTIDDVDVSDWDKVAELNNTLTRLDGDTLTRIGFDPKLPEFLPLWAKANGVSLLSDDGRTAQLNDPKVIEALEFANGLHDVAGGRENFLAFRDTWDFFGANNEFVADQLGVFPMEQWYVNVLAADAPDAPVAFKAFTDREGNPITYATGNTWAIPKGSKNVDAACAWMKTMTSVDTWVAAAQERARLRQEAGTTNTGVYTGNRLADEKIFSEIVQPGDNEVFNQGVQTVLSVMDTAFAIPANPAGLEFRDAWQNGVNRVLNGEQSVQEAMDQAQEEAQAALDEAWSQ